MSAYGNVDTIATSCDSAWYEIRQWGDVFIADSFTTSSIVELGRFRTADEAYAAIELNCRSRGLVLA